MKKSKIIITFVIILSITLLGVCTYAGSKGKGHGMFGFGKFENSEFCRMPKLTEEELAQKKSEFQAELKAKLDDGKITEEQYNKMLEKIEEGKMPFSKHSEKDLEKIKEKGEFDKNQVKRKRPDFSEKDLSQMKEKMISDLKAKLEEGKITEEQYNEMLQKIDEGKPPMPGRMHGEKPMKKGFPRGEHKKFKDNRE